MQKTARTSERNGFIQRWKVLQIIGSIAYGSYADNIRQRDSTRRLYWQLETGCVLAMKTESISPCAAVSR